MKIPFASLVSFLGFAYAVCARPLLAQVGHAGPTHTGGRILVVTDMEGLSGVNDGRMVSTAVRSAAYYAQGLDRLHVDVNATIAGLFDGGATEIDVVDTHSDGRNLQASRLDRRAHLLPQDVPRDPYYGLATATPYDAIVAVGMHDKPLSGGFLAHTLGAGLSPVINGATLTETELLGYEFGTVDVPVIFVSGDDHLQQDLEHSMPWLVYVVVKRATGYSTAELLPTTEVETALRTGARRAIESLPRMRSLKVTPPIRAGLLATYPMSLPQQGSPFSKLPGVEYHGDTVTFAARDYAEAYTRIRFLVAFASTRKDQSMLQLIGSRPDGSKVLQAVADSVFALLPAFEAGSWRPGMPPPKLPSPR